MASLINTTNIDIAYPIAGQDNDSQGFRDNFTNIKSNLDQTKLEIEELQPGVAGDLLTYGTTGITKLTVGVTNGWVLMVDSTEPTGMKWALSPSTELVNDTTPQLGGNLDVQTRIITTSTTDGSITLTPDGTGDVVLGTMTFDADQVIGAGQDNYVMTYDNGTGKISLEAAAGGSPLTTKGDIYTYDTGDARLPVGSDGHVLTADSAEATGVKWAAAGGGGGGPTILATPETLVDFDSGSGWVTITSTTAAGAGATAILVRIQTRIVQNGSANNIASTLYLDDGPAPGSLATAQKAMELITRTDDAAVSTNLICTDSGQFTVPVDGSGRFTYQHDGVGVNQFTSFQLIGYYT